MNILDIIIIGVLLIGLIKGWQSGILVQLSGIIGVVLGAWLAYKFAEKTCEWLGLSVDFKILIFIALLVIILTVVVVMSKLLTALLTAGGLSLPIRLLGGVISVLKITLIMALVIRTYENVDKKIELGGTDYIKESATYPMMDQVATTLFPYLNSMVQEHFQTNREDQVEQQLKSKEIRVELRRLN